MVDLASYSGGTQHWPHMTSTVWERPGNAHPPTHPPVLVSVIIEGSTSGRAVSRGWSAWEQRDEAIGGDSRGLQQRQGWRFCSTHHLGMQGRQQQQHQHWQRWS
jgi:hypothetical protein